MDKSYDYGFDTHIAVIDRSAIHQLEEFDVIGKNGEVLPGIKRLNMDTPDTYIQKGGGFDILSDEMKEYLKQKYNPEEMTTELHFEMMSELAALGVIGLKEWSSWSDIMHMDLGLIGFEDALYTTMLPSVKCTSEQLEEISRKQNEAEWLKVFSNKQHINWFKYYSNFNARVSEKRGIVSDYSDFQKATLNIMSFFSEH